MNLKCQIGQQDSGIGGSLLISFLSNSNLTAIHGQKYPCGSFEKQVGYYDLGGAQNKGHFAKESPYQSAGLTTAVLTIDRKSKVPLWTPLQPHVILLYLAAHLPMDIAVVIPTCNSPVNTVLAVDSEAAHAQFQPLSAGGSVHSGRGGSPAHVVPLLSI